MTYKHKGMSILEMMIVVSIIALVVVLGGPTIVESQRIMRHKGAVETAYFTLQSARAGAISRAANTTINFETEDPWCIGVSDVGVCDCQTLDSCTVDGVEQIIQQSDYNGITLQEINFGGNDFMVFDGQRGLALGNAGSFVFSDGNVEARIEVSTLGRVRICTEEGNLGNYPAC
ncbi:GspH/FimT family pseudopilin [Aestuariibacter salexigens]|uniref:GspH/FimT family pseudopilin n=1 Tax=Aestuariibacter salexigens TaxID=226010 RepID=UPI00041201B6|nr:GspH/FimT family pseudopilin [Aestuariibacter salexigens]